MQAVFIKKSHLCIIVGVLLMEQYALFVDQEMQRVAYNGHERGVHSIKFQPMVKPRGIIVMCQCAYNINVLI